MDYPLLNVFFTTMWVFLWIMWFFLLFRVFADLFRDDSISGWGKAGWSVFIILLPFLGVFVYLIAQGQAMGERRMAEMQSAQADMDAYVKQVASSADPSEQIAKAKGLLDSGAITQAEFEQIKAKALTA